MSEMVKCDSCGKIFYTDSREDKGVYIKLTADDPLYGFSSFHLCRKCYKEKLSFLRDESEFEED